MKLAVVFLVFALVEGSTAFFFGLFSPSGRQSAVEAKQDSCIDKARQGVCAFYTCFNQRHPCDSDNYAIKYGWRYCSRFDQHYERLTDEGLNWLNKTRVCSMEKMLDFYHAEHVNCGDLENKMKDEHAKCEAEHGLCDGHVIAENKDVFADVYSINRRSAVRFAMNVKQCAITKFREVSSWVHDKVDNVGELSDTLAPFWRNFEQQMEQLGQDLKAEADKLGRDLRKEADKLADKMRRLAKGTGSGVFEMDEWLDVEQDEELTAPEGKGTDEGKSDVE